MHTPRENLKLMNNVQLICSGIICGLDQGFSQRRYLGTFWSPFKNLNGNYIILVITVFFEKMQICGVRFSRKYRSYSICPWLPRKQEQRVTILNCQTSFCRRTQTFKGWSTGHRFKIIHNCIVVWNEATPGEMISLDTWE